MTIKIKIRVEVLKKTTVSIVCVLIEISRNGGSISEILERRVFFICWIMLLADPKTWNFKKKKKIKERDCHRWYDACFCIGKMAVWSHQKALKKYEISLNVSKLCKNYDKKCPYNCHYVENSSPLNFFLLYLSKIFTTIGIFTVVIFHCCTRVSIKIVW